MNTETQKLYYIVSRIVDRRHDEIRISPSWIATEALREMDPTRVSVPLVYLGCHLQLRQIARHVCRVQFEDTDDEPRSQHELFPDLQWRYPTARSSKDEEPEYVLLDNMSQEDIAYNVARLRREAKTKLEHADALEAFGRQHRRAS